LWSLLIGNAFAGAAFVGHETMHGAVVRNKWLRQLVGWICFLPYTLSPTLWNAWHNKVHHGNTGIDGIDPDSFPFRKVWDESVTMRIADRFVPGYKRPFGWVGMVMGFHGQATQMLVVWMKKTDALDAAGKRRAWLETIAGWAFWAALGWWIGPMNFLFAFVLSIVVGNVIVISYIYTNHSLSPMNDINDPLYNSLSVEVPPIVNLFHLNFGLHVEHHLFPSMSSAYAPHVRDALVAQFPDRYQSMPLLRALWLLFTTPRIYQSPTTLVDPLSGHTASTLLPRTPARDVEDLPTAA
jgi:fatty acid desaturase